jgi:hypothetical protein
MGDEGQLIQPKRCYKQGFPYCYVGSASKTSTGCRYDSSWECGDHSALVQEAISKPAHSHPGRVAGYNVLYCREACGI